MCEVDMLMDMLTDLIVVNILQCVHTLYQTIQLYLLNIQNVSLSIKTQ